MEDAFLNCKRCGTQGKIMKRCTRCKHAYYCCRDCQIQDWPLHRTECRQSVNGSNSQSEKQLQHRNVDRVSMDLTASQKNSSNTECRQSVNGSNSQSEKQLQHRKAQDFRKDDQSIFADDLTEEEQTDPVVDEGCRHTPLVNFNLAVKPATRSQVKDKSAVTTSCGEVTVRTYLYRDEECMDVPELDINQTHCQIFVKYNKMKHKIYIQKSWTGSEIYKVLSHELKIPLENLKVIHKGKLLSVECIGEAVEERAVLQAIGEMAASGEGLDKHDISVMMQQLGLKRNEAIKALRNTKGDLIDAIIEAGKK